MIWILKKWWQAEEAVAAIEAALILPVMLMILVGVVDLGTALNINQKVSSAAGMMSDLLSRDEDVTAADLNDAVVAAELALAPYDIAPMGYDVAGVQFINPAKTPTVQWRSTFNMNPNGDVTVDSAGLGNENDGVVAVTIEYAYVPLFTSTMFGSYTMKEVFYTRGRRSAFVTGTCCP